MTAPHLKILIPSLLLLIIIAALAAQVKFPKETGFDQFFFGSKNLARLFAQELLNQQTQQEIAKLPGHWGIAIRDLKTGKTYLKNATDQFTAASLYKLAVMWAAFEAIDKQQVKKDDLEPQLTSMITYSDNDSAVYLAEKLGWGNIQSLMDQEGLGAIDLADPPKISAQSALTLLERIYRGSAVSPTASQEMKELLFAQTINDRIPKYLPEGVKVAHKTGELDNLRHDAGIVLGKNSHYIFVFLSETPVPEETSEQIAQLSKKIYAALENQ
ncbi:serine hydrolase [Candidatus Curtissbacteria bacterium]|nr:serine hydrolase [Candidatus Curtissbacteria bacterium]